MTMSPSLRWIMIVSPLITVAVAYLPSNIHLANRNCSKEIKIILLAFNLAGYFTALAVLR
jgi:ABC-type multidrug transport system permease subunit